MSERLQGEPEMTRELCHSFDLELGEYLEGEHRPSVVGHARECPFCSVVLADLEQIRKASQEMGTEDPPAAVWAKLHARLAAEGYFKEQGSRLGWLRGPAWQRMTAPVSALAGLAIAGALFLAGPPALERLAAPAPGSAGPSASAEKPPLPSEDAVLVKTVSDLEQSFAAREKSLEPAVKETYRKSLNSLDASIRECSESLKEEPSNTLAEEYRLAAYTQKAELLETALEFDAR